jgi:hypothetical protein
MNRETLKWKAFLFSLTGWAKQSYKLHGSSCHDSSVILKDQFCFAFFTMSFIILLKRKERVWEQPGPDTINLLCRV